MKKVSVIIPVYNISKYIHRCLNSIIEQTDNNFEIILICDGFDEDMKICEEYAKKNSYITLIKNIKKGLGGARNAGIKAARGEWISFIDSDDWIEPDFIEKMLTLAQSDKEIDIVQCGTRIVYEYPVEEQFKKNDNAYFSIPSSGVEVINNDIYGRINVGSWNKLYRKSRIDEFQLEFPELMCNEDACFTWCFWACSRKIGYIKDKLYNYVRRKNSLMAQTFEKNMGEKVLDHLKIENIFYSFLQQYSLFDKFSYGFWRSYEISWWFVNSNANEEFKKKGFYYAKKFLENKDIPIKFELINKIKTLHYEEFMQIGHHYVKIFKLFGFNIAKKIKHDNYRQIIIFSLINFKYKKHKHHILFYINSDQS